VLDYLVKGRVRRELFRLLWGMGAAGNISDLARRAKVTFSAAHKELEAMRGAGLARAERRGTEMVYRAETEHPYAGLLRQFAKAPAGLQAHERSDHDDDVRGWLAAAGAPLGSPGHKRPSPPLEEALAEGLALSHRDATVARVLPLVLWRQRGRLDLDRLVREASRRDERATLGYFLELAGQFGGDADLVRAARALRDRRRTGTRPFFTGPQGPHAAAVARRNTPKEALRWGYVMNMGLDSFKAMFDKFEGPA
jgi:DNA-binding transcriptional ArsR family regulator